MSFRISTTSRFRKEAKRLMKKFSSLNNELAQLGNLLQINPKEGTSIGNNCYKIRLGIASKGRGKSG